MFFVYLIIALAAGVALATQSAINTQLAKAMSGEAVIATFISFAVGTIVLFFIAWVKTDLWGNLSAIPSQPWWKLIGGVLGAIVVFTTVLLEIFCRQIQNNPLIRLRTQTTYMVHFKRTRYEHIVRL